MRVATLLLCLPLGACAGGQLAGDPSASTASAAAMSMRAASGPSAGGGATTASARSSEPVQAAPDPLMQARADCWMKVEGQKSLRGIDQRVAFVDSCVAAQMKGRL